MVKKRKSKTHPGGVPVGAITANREGAIQRGVGPEPYQHVVTLQECLEARGKEYRPSLSFLKGLLNDADSWNDSQLKDSLILEAVVIALLTTKAGFSVLALLGPQESPPLSNCLSANRKWVAEYEKRGSLHPHLISNWRNDQETFLQFLQFLLEGPDVYLPCERFVEREWKLPLLFLVRSKYMAAELILDPGYNLLVDYILAVAPLCNGWLRRALCFDDGNFVKDIVINYKRVYDFSGNFEWYSFSNNDTKRVCVSRSFLVSLLSAGSEGKSLKSDVSSDTELDDEGLSTQQICSIIDELSTAPLKSSFHNTQDPSLEEFSENYCHQVNQEEQVFSFDLNQDGSLELPNLMSHAAVRHEILMKVLKLPNSLSPLLPLQFKIIAGLVDPLTQPAPNDKHVISLDLLYQMFLGFLTPEVKLSLDVEEGCDWRFHVCFNMQKIINASLKRLNFDDFERLNSINNSDENVDWRSQLDKWLPHGLNTQDLELICMVDIVAVYTIYKLYEHLPIQMNPFLSSLISLWKNLTCVILLGLEIDRIEEEQETFDTPLMVRATIRGAAALRAIVATILNGHIEATKHDIKHESLNTFMSPHGRKLCQGALYAELRSHAAALLALGSELEDVTELFADLQPGDRFDEDVRYMFEYEFEDYNDLSSREDYSESEKLEEFTESSKAAVCKGRRCNCIFDDDEMLEDEDYDNDDEAQKFKKHVLHEPNPTTSVTMSSTGKPHAVRSGSSFEFDYSGKDWRDIPRVANLYYSPNYQFTEELNSGTILSLTNKATKQRLSEAESLLLMSCVATCVKNEQDEIILGNITELHQNNDKKKKNMDTSDSQVIGTFKEMTPDDIYELWCKDSTFEKIVYCNHEVAWRLMDEMLMCSGFRRVLLWFITHMELNHSLIHYIFELVMGLRKSSEDTKENENDDMLPPLPNDPSETNSLLPFSRQGAIQLSAIETKMLLQEFFTNAAIFLTEKSKEWISDEPSKENDSFGNTDNGNVSLYAVGLMKLICLMVRAFIKKGKFDFRESECVFELQTLLMNWITIIPEAKDLFFELKSMIAEIHNEESSGTDDDRMPGTTVTNMPQNDDLNQPVDSEYNRKLVGLLSPVIHGKEENAAVGALRNFIEKYSFDTSVSMVGRKVVYETDEILPLPESETPLSLVDYLNDTNLTDVEHHD